MITGVETAGLVLAAFPLLIEGLKLYVTSAGQVKEMWQYRKVLMQFQRAIDIEWCKFYNTWLLLIELAGEDPEEAENLPWSKAFEDKLLNFLGSTSRGPFIGACEDINSILEELKSKFKAFEKNQAGYKRMLNAVTVGISGDYRTSQLTRLRQLNYDLDKLVNGTRQFPAPVPTLFGTININVAEKYKRVRQHAKMLHSALYENFLQTHCPCKMPHVTNLELEIRDVCPKKKRGVTLRESPRAPGLSLPLPFSLLFPPPPEHNLQLGSQWRQLEFEHINTAPAPRLAGTGGYPKLSLRNVEATHPEYNMAAVKRQRVEVDKPSPAAAAVMHKTKGPIVSAPVTRKGFKSSTNNVPNPLDQIIYSLCSTLMGTSDAHSSICLGMLITHDDITHDDIRHRVRLASTSLSIAFKPVKTISLADILSRPSPSRKERLKLGVKLASSVMQLHETEWLSERWGKENIFFLDEEESSQAVLEMPLVHRVFVPDSLPKCKSTSESRIIRCNMSLFSLGIILLELWYWKPLQKDNTTSLTLDSEKYRAANSWIDDHLYGDAGDNYGDIVRRCINGLDHKETRLEDDGFKDEAYAKIVQPLEEHLKLFCNQLSLEEIFRKPVC